MIRKGTRKLPEKQLLYTAVTAVTATHTRVPGSSLHTYASKVTDTQYSSPPAAKCAQEAEGLPWCHNGIAKSNQVQNSYALVAIFRGGVQEYRKKRGTNVPLPLHPPISVNSSMRDPSFSSHFDSIPAHTHSHTAISTHRAGKNGLVCLAAA